MFTRDLFLINTHPTCNLARWWRRSKVLLVALPIDVDSSDAGSSTSSNHLKSNFFDKTGRKTVTISQDEDSFSTASSTQRFSCGVS